jgi:hypothetical protein
MKTMKISLMACIALVLGFASCKKDDNKIKETKIIKTDSIRVNMNMRSGPYTFFSLKDNQVIANSDSNSTKWDFGMRFVNIIVNSHASGPGTAGVITQTGIYDNYLQAPETGYAYDTTSLNTAINASTTLGWYDYNPVTHGFDPKAGMFFVFKTSDNKYAKLEMLSARYEPFTGPFPEYVWYKFRYTYQADGSTKF